MEATFGNRLRLQREQQQVPLAAIAERTKIKASLLEGLERDDVSQWPAGIFRRSFVKAYAHAIGLDGESVLREFLELYPEPPAEDVAAVLAAARESRRPPTRLGYLISTAISALPGRAAGRKPGAAGEAETEPVTIGPAAPVALRASPPEEAGRNESRDLSEAGVELTPAAIGHHSVESRADVGFDDLAEPQPYEPDLLSDAPSALDEPAHAIEQPASGRLLESRPSAREPALSVVADLCARLACATHARDVAVVLADTARVINAVGVIVWMWDPTTRTLGHVLAHGYSCDVLSRLPRVRCDADNAIADAFRSGETRVVNGGGAATGAVVVPMMTAAGAAGVLALELQDRGEEQDWVRAVGTILGSQFSALFGFQVAAEAVSA